MPTHPRASRTRTMPSPSRDFLLPVSFTARISVLWGKLLQCVGGEVDARF